MFEIFKKCFEINLNDYENIKFSLEINKVVLGASIVLIIGIILFNTYRSTIRNVVMQLIRREANSEENAKTVDELRLNRTFALKYVFKGNNVLSKIVARVGEKQYSYDEYVALDKKERAKIDSVDFDSARFYLKEEERDLALSIVDKYATSPLRTAMAAALVGIVCICIIACMPGILNVIDKILKIL